MESPTRRAISLFSDLWTIYSALAVVIAAAAGIAFDAITDAPWYLTVPFVLGVLAAALGAGLRWGPDLRGHPPQPDPQETAEAPRRIGYVGRQGSYGNLSRARFGDRLDTGIDSEGDVDARDATFGENLDARRDREDDERDD